MLLIASPRGDHSNESSLFTTRDKVLMTQFSTNLCRCGPHQGWGIILLSPKLAAELVPRSQSVPALSPISSSQAIRLCPLFSKKEGTYLSKVRRKCLMSGEPFCATRTKSSSESNKTSWSSNETCSTLSRWTSTSSKGAESKKSDRIGKEISLRRQKCSEYRTREIRCDTRQRN